MHTFAMKTKILSGDGSLDFIKSLKADSVCVVTDVTMRKIGVVDEVTRVLEEAGIPYRLFDSVEANPSLETVQKGLHHIIENKPEALIAVGGGSVIDAAKAIMYFCIKTKEELVHKTEIHKPLFIAIPTTSGTGSEVTSFSVITDHQTHTKIPLTDELMLPDVAILDARFTLSVPPFVTADTGMDVITHALEAYVATSANPFSDVYAEKALDHAFRSLLKAFESGDDIVARQSMHDASCMAGIAFTNAGLGINHSLAHVIGGRFRISHGRANAILLPHVIAYNAGVLDGSEDTYGERYDAVAIRLGLNMPTRKARVLALIELIKRYNEKLEIPSTFKAFGLAEETYMNGLEEMATIALSDVCTGSNPRRTTREALVQILKSAY